MRKIMLAAAILGLAGSPAGALEIKNVRNRYFFHPAPFASALRPDLKLQGGDIIYLTYDLDGLKLNEKGNFKFVTLLELLDSGNKQIFSKEIPVEVIPHLGGGRVPGEIVAAIPFGQTPGKYNVKVTITDQNVKDKTTKSFLYPFEVLKDTFGVMRVSAQGVSFVGAYHVTEFVLVNMKLNAKKEPAMDLTMRVLDSGGKEVNKLVTSFPKDLPEDALKQMEKANFLPWHYPLYLNRAGRFTIEITAKDTSGGGTITFTVPLEVIDTPTLLSK